MEAQLDLLRRLWRSGEPFALAHVVETFGSAPRPAGATMAITADGDAFGSVSGGCVEGAVYELGQDALSTGVPSLHRFGISDEFGIEVGLTCGGMIDIFVERLSHDSFPEFEQLDQAARAGTPVSVATAVEHPDPTRLGRKLVVEATAAAGSLGSTRFTDTVIDDARGFLAAGRTGTIGYGLDGERRGEGAKVYIETRAAPPRIIIFGAIDFAAALSAQAGLMGFHVTVCDARPVFATRTRMRDADDVVVSWPDAYLAREVEAGRVDPTAAVCVLTHDPKFDVPLLTALLDLPPHIRPGYIGAMGSRRAHEDRTRRLLEAGVEPAVLDLISSPIGLDLGARTPAETAVSIAAEIIARRWEAPGGFLSRSDARIHREVPVPASQLQAGPRAALTSDGQAPGAAVMETAKPSGIPGTGSKRSITTGS